MGEIDTFNLDCSIDHWFMKWGQQRNDKILHNLEQTLWYSNMVRLTNSQKWELVSLGTRGGWTQRALAAEFHVSQSMISKLRNKKRQSGDVKDRPRSGRPRVTNNQHDQFIARRAQQNPIIDSHIINDQLRTRHNIVISQMTS